MTRGARRWYRDDDNAVVRRDLDGLTALYHRPSGMTHIADSPVPEVLDALTSDPQPLERIASRLADAFDLADDPESQGLEQHLGTLVALGLARVTD